MAYYPLDENDNKQKAMFKEEPECRKKLKKILIITAIIVLGLGGLFYYKASSIFSKISTGGDGLLSGLFKGEEDLKGVGDGRINVLLL